MFWLRRLTSFRRQRPITLQLRRRAAKLFAGGLGSFSTTAASVETRDSPRKARWPVIIREHRAKGKMSLRVGDGFSLLGDMGHAAEFAFVGVRLAHIHGAGGFVGGTARKPSATGSQAEIQHFDAAVVSPMILRA